MVVTLIMQQNTQNFAKKRKEFYTFKKYPTFMEF